MEEERVYNELSHASAVGLATPTPAGVHRTRTVSSPVPVMPGPSPQGGPASIPVSTSRPLSPGLNYGEGTSQRRESGHTPLFTPPPTIMHGRVHSLTTPPGPSIVGVPSPSPPPPTALPPSRPRPHGPHMPPTTKFSWFCDAITHSVEISWIFQLLRFYVKSK